MKSSFELSKISLNFPSSPTKEIFRENIYETLEGIFKDNQIIFLVGNEAIGKTILCSQFVRRHNTRSISVFLNPLNSVNCDINNFIFDVANQINYIIEQKEIEKVEEVDIMKLRILYTQLNKTYRFETVYFVIDGLDHIAENQQQFISEIMDILPFNPNFKFLISGDIKNLISFLPKSKSILTFPYAISPFSISEINNLFEDTEGANQDTIRRVKDLTGGFPGKLDNVKRIIKSKNLSLQDFLNSVDNYSELFEYDWKNTDAQDQELLQILAMLVYFNKIPTLNNIAQVLKIDADIVKNKIKDLSFINIDEQSGKVEISSVAYKNFVEAKLHNLKTEITYKIIDELIKPENLESSLYDLPYFYNEIGNYEKVIEYLSNKNIEIILKKEQSLTTVQKQIHLGFDSSKTSNNFPSSLRFSILLGIFSDLEELQVLESEIEARISMGQIKIAALLAKSPILKEDRLMLLSIYVKKLKLKKIEVEQEVIDEIKFLFENTELTNLKEKIVDLASNLLYSIPVLAIDLIEKTRGQENSEDYIDDVALAKLSLTAIKSNTNEEERNKTIEQINSKIADKSNQKILKSLLYLVENYSVEKLIEEVGAFDDLQKQISFLRIWIVAESDKKTSDDYLVIEYIIKLILQNSSVKIPDIKILIDVSRALQNLSDAERNIKLIGSLDSFKEILKRSSSTIDFIKFQTNLFLSEIKINYDAAVDRILDIVYEVQDLSDLSIKSECLSIIYRVLKIGNNQKLENQYQFTTAVKNDLEASIENLINSTSLHEKLLKNIISELAVIDPEMLVRYADSLNTKDRRNEAYFNILKEYLDVDFINIDENFVMYVINKLDYEFYKSSSILNTLEVFEINSDKVKTKKRLFYYLKEKIDSFYSLKMKCGAFKIIYNITKEDANAQKSELESIKNKLIESWELIDLIADKIITGFNIVEHLSKSDMELGMEFLSKCLDEKERTWLNSFSRDRVYFLNLKLMIKAFTGLIPKTQYTDFDFNQIKSCIGKIPSLEDRINLWTDLALSFYINKIKTNADDIVQNEIKPLLGLIKDKKIRFQSITNCAPALFLYHNKTAIEIIGAIDEEYCEEAHSNICDFIFSKCLPNDPFDWSKDFQFKTKYEELVDIISELTFINTDFLLYNYVKLICKAMGQKSLLTREQIFDLQKKVTDVIDTKLPDKNNITHDGYKLISRSNLLKVIRKESKDLNNWNHLISSAESIPNLSDKAYVLAIIANNIPSELTQLRESTIRKSISYIELIPSHKERVKRYETIVDIIRTINKDICNEVLQNFIKPILSSSNDLFGATKKIINFIHSFDEKLVSEFTKFIDDDPARPKVSNYFSKQFEIQKLKDNFINNNELEITGKKAVDNIIKAADLILPALNSEKIGTKKPEIVISWLNVSLHRPFSKLYNVYLYIVENLVKRYSKTDEPNNHLKSVFKNFLLNLQLLEVIMSSTNSSDINKVASFDTSEIAESVSNIILTPNSRNTAMDFLTNWVRVNCKKQLLICDPFFSSDDLDFIKLISDIHDNLKITILTGSGSNNSNLTNPNSTFKNKWDEISEQDPPDVKIIITYTKNLKKSPIHDRWIISDIAGLRIGTSLNSIGISKNSEISKLNTIEIVNIEAMLQGYLNLTEKLHDGEKLEYFAFYL